MTQKQENERPLNVVRFRQLNDDEPTTANLLVWLCWYRDEKKFPTISGAVEYLQSVYARYTDEIEIVASFRHPEPEDDGDDNDA